MGCRQRDGPGWPDHSRREGKIDVFAGDTLRRPLESGAVFRREWINPPLHIDLRSTNEPLRLIRDATGRYEMRS